MSTKPEQRSSTAMAAEVIRLIQDRNYGMAEAKAAALQLILEREKVAIADATRAMREATPVLNQPKAKDTKPDTFIEVMQHQIDAINSQGPQGDYQEGIRDGFRHASEVYKELQEIHIKPHSITLDGDDESVIADMANVIRALPAGTPLTIHVRKGSDEDDLARLVARREGTVGIDLKRLNHRIAALQNKIDNQRRRS